MTAIPKVNLNVFFKKVGSGIALARVLPRTGMRVFYYPHPHGDVHADGNHRLIDTDRYTVRYS